MKFEYSKLLDLMPNEAERVELRRLSKEYYESAQSLPGNPGERAQVDSKRSELLDGMLEKIQWHMRAMRHPMPNRAELAEMVTEEFEK